MAVPPGEPESVAVGVQDRPARARDHGFHPLRVRRIVPETTDTVSVVLDVPDDLRDAFTYAAGQFLTFRVRLDGEEHLRSYSMSSSPEVDDELQVTVKRVDGGAVSTWANESLAAGDVVESTRPAGHFCLDSAPGALVAFAGGSGITPIFSLLKTALASTSRPVRLLYANRDRESVIFDRELAALAERHPGRVELVHHCDADDGFVVDSAIAAYIDDTASYYVCGPGPFMDLVEQTLGAHGTSPDRIHIERFTPAGDDVPATPAEGAAEAGTIEVTIELRGETKTGAYRPGTTILQTARSMGLKPPYSCEAGDCATCMAKLLHGAATMRANNALFEDEVADGYVLTCQAEPTETVHVIYED